jgi:methionine synthase II (cobalamin-independent)
VAGLRGHRAPGRLVGRENVIGGSDCGFATVASLMPIDPKVTFAKLQALAAGAEPASGELWGGRPAHVPVALHA